MLNHKPFYETHFTDLTLSKRTSLIIRNLHKSILNHVEDSYYPFLVVTDQLPLTQTIFSQLNELEKKGIHSSEVILVISDSACENKPGLWELMETGIKDIYFWAGEQDFQDYIINTVQRRQKVAAILESSLVKNNLVGESALWKNFLTKLIEATLYSECSFLFTGESGTGKELLSRLVHTIDPREDKKDLVLLDCSTIVPELSGSEFFGHERGSYTNAMQTREGAFALANKGTLFLDEIGELHLPLQAGLLRVIQEGTYKKVGSNTWQKTHFRLVSATNKDLHKQVEENKFRQDLFYRISDFEFQVPTLAERREDIPLLANHFLQQFSKDKEVIEFDNTVMDFIKDREYKGNIRELKQLIQRIVLRHVKHKKISIGEIPVEEKAHPLKRENGKGNTLESVVKEMILNGESYNSIKDKAGLAAFEASIEISGGNKQRAAERLGIDVRTVQLGLKKKG